MASAAESPTDRVYCHHNLACVDPDMVVYTVPAPGAGAAAHQYLAVQVPDWLHVITLRLPGRENRFVEPPFRSMGEAVDYLTQRVVADVDGHRKPFLLFGDCAGAYLAYEVCRALAARGIHAAALIVLGQWSPSSVGGRPRLHDLPAANLRAELLESGVLASDIANSDALFGLFERTLRADLELLHGYRWDVSQLLDLRIVVLTGRLQGRAAPAALRGWVETTSGPVEVVEAAEGEAVAAALARAASGCRPM
jgi:surfactin synthase thioesterase subunit